MHLPGLAAPDDERERRQIRATYYGAQREVDDRLGQLFDYLDRTGLAADTLVVVTGDHGEMGGDHWLLEKLGYWDESYHVPLIVRDPRPAADGARGTVVRHFTESVDLLPTICEWLGIDVPAQADGWPLTPFLHGAGAPAALAGRRPLGVGLLEPAGPHGRAVLRHPLGPLRPGRGPRRRAQVRAVRRRPRRAAPAAGSTWPPTPASSRTGPATPGGRTGWPRAPRSCCAGGCATMRGH